MRVSFKSFTEVDFVTSKFGRKIQLTDENCIDDEIHDVEHIIETDGKDKDLWSMKSLVCCSLIHTLLKISDSLLVLRFALVEGQRDISDSDVTRVFEDVYVNPCDVSVRIMAVVNDLMV